MLISDPLKFPVFGNSMSSKNFSHSIRISNGKAHTYMCVIPSFFYFPFFVCHLPFHPVLVFISLARIVLRCSGLSVLFLFFLHSSPMYAPLLCYFFVFFLSRSLFCSLSLFTSILHVLFFSLFSSHLCSRSLLVLFVSLIFSFSPHSFFLIPTSSLPSFFHPFSSPLPRPFLFSFSPIFHSSFILFCTCPLLQRFYPFPHSLLPPPPFSVAVALPAENYEPWKTGF